MRILSFAPFALIAASQCFYSVAGAQGSLGFLYNFSTSTNAPKSPYGALTYVGGNFYGESAGGIESDGDVFELTAAGKVRVAYSFADALEGAYYPIGGLTFYQGKLYGVTLFGGTYGKGAVFVVSPSGEQTIHSFVGGVDDGASPHAALAILNGTLYGTTRSGGAYGAGAIFAITPAGAETVLHSFGAAGDGQDPVTPLLAVGSTLYGTTLGGGGAKNISCETSGCGTLFAITAAGTESVLHAFSGAGDGGALQSSLFLLGGTIYSNTSVGGSANCGTAFMYTPGASKVTTIHQFAGGTSDVCNPQTGFTMLNGTLYATAAAPGTGAIFAMSTSGETSIDFIFDAAEGAALVSTLTAKDGTLWGTAEEGGLGWGTLFGVSP